MSENPKVPVVAFFLMKAENISGIRFGYLVTAPDGKHWAIRDKGRVGQGPNPALDVELDPAQLVEQPNMPDGEPLYLYRTPFRDDQ